VTRTDAADFAFASSKESALTASAIAVIARRSSTAAWARSVLSSSRIFASSATCASSSPSLNARKRSGLLTPKPPPPNVAWSSSPTVCGSRRSIETPGAQPAYAPQREPWRPCFHQCTMAGRIVPPLAGACRARRFQSRGHLYVEPEVREDFEWFQSDPRGPAVVLATEGHDLRIADLQPAFRRLVEGATLYTLQRNRYFRKGGELVTDLGPVAAFLAYASGREAETLGKPSELLFDAVA